MKSNFIVLLIVGLCVISCSNDEVVPKDQLQINISSRSQDSILNFMPQDQIDLISASFSPDCSDHASILGQITIQDGVLNFNNLIHYENCIKCLEDLLEGHHNSFEQSNSGLSAEELDSLGDSIGFRYFKPLEDFEASMGFNSRRALIESEILDWLDVDSELLDWQSNPDGWDDFSEEERTLMTQSGLVSINGYLINMLELDNYYSSKHHNSGCFMQRRSVVKKWRYLSGDDNKSTDLLFKNTTYPWKLKIKSKIVHYRKRRGKWRRRRAELRTACSGVITTNNCNTVTSHGESVGFKKRKKLKAKRSWWGAEGYRHRENAQVGVFCVDNDQQCRVIIH